MNEQEWLTATDPKPMLEYLEGKVSDRKLRLLAVACCYQACRTVPSDSLLQEYEVVIRFVDGKADLDAVRGHWSNDFVSAGHSYPEQPFKWSMDFVSIAHSNAADPFHPGYPTNAEALSLLREIFGNPFRPVAFSGSWRTSTAENLAQTIYEDPIIPSGAFDNQRMGILADALEEAGCDNADILNHCRSDGPHVRGCWALDLIVGKT